MATRKVSPRIHHPRWGWGRVVAVQINHHGVPCASVRWESARGVSGAVVSLTNPDLTVEGAAELARMTAAAFGG